MQILGKETSLLLYFDRLTSPETNLLYEAENYEVLNNSTYSYKLNVRLDIEPYRPQPLLDWLQENLPEETLKDVERIVIYTCW